MDNLWFANNQAVFDEFANVLTRVGVADLVDFVWVKPDLSLSAAENACCEAFLGAKIDPTNVSLIQESVAASSLSISPHCRNVSLSDGCVCCTYIIESLVIVDERRKRWCVDLRSFDATHKLSHNCKHRTRATNILT